MNFEAVFILKVELNLKILDGIVGSLKRTFEIEPLSYIYESFIIDEKNQFFANRRLFHMHTLIFVE